MLTRGDRYTLEPVEQRLAVHLAKAREQANVSYSGPNPSISPRAGVESNLMGVGAEIAFARLLNIYPDLTIGVRKGGPDCVLHNGETVDLKATPYVDRPLLVVKLTKRLSDADYYACFTCDYPTYVFVGWASAARVKAVVKDIGHGPSHVLTPAELEPTIITADELRWAAS